MVRIIYCLLVFLFLVPLSKNYAQVSGSKIKSSAQDFFKKEKYTEALDLFQKYQRLQPDDVSVIAPIGICQYMQSDIKSAIRNLQIVVANSKKPEAEHIYYLARAQHAASRFEAAAKNYKLFLKNAGNHPYRRMVKDFIRRCDAGLRLIGAEELAIVENLGGRVNSVYDEIAPLLSPNYNNKLYFASARYGSIGGLRDAEGNQDNEYGSFRTDMFSTYEKNGQWGQPESMPGLLNTARNDVILDFAMNGQVLVFFKSNDLISGEILVDTFGVEDQKLFPERFKGPLSPEQGDGQLYFFNDTTILFSGRRAEGYGGLDIYITRYSLGKWQTPINLGPEINTPYDEANPFLSKDGRSLYFSSNRLTSMGGMDIFMARYYDQQEKWAEPKNLGAPINSPGDDTYFRIDNTGLKAFFSSERDGGYGGSDIYLAYFKQKRNEQLSISRPNLFIDVPAYRRSVREESTMFDPPPVIASNTDNVEIPTTAKYIFRPLYVGTNDQVLSPGNTQMMDKIKNLMQANPQLNLVLTGHGDGKSPADFELYFSVKRAEKVADYLMQNGVEPNRILVRGVGVQYPYLKMSIESGPQINVDKFNRRIEYYFTGLEGSGIVIEMEEQRLRDNLKDPAREALQNLEKGLYYRVQVAAVGQNFNGLKNFRDEDWIVQRPADGLSLKYMVGAVRTFKEALMLKNNIVEGGQPGAFVIPFLNGYSLKRSEILQLAQKYPDLQSYLGSGN